MNNLYLKIKTFIKQHDWKLWTKIIMFSALLILVALDQVIKYLVQKHLEMGVEYHFLPGFINFKYIINYGSAFGLNQGNTALLITFAFIIIVVLSIWFVFSKSVTNIVGVTFILSGTIGNLTDRFIHNGGVVDFLVWDLFEPKTIFNVADMMVTLGIIIIVIYLIVSFIISVVNIAQEKKMEQKKNDKK